MSKRIRDTGPKPKLVRDTSPALPLVAPGIVVAGLGGEAADAKLRGALAPITLFAVRSELLGRLKSSGGRPALSGVERRPKIPLVAAEWGALEELAAAVTQPGFAPTAGQLASVLLTLSIRSLTAQLASPAAPQA